MQTSAHEIKDKLLRALDPEYNVVDMATVFEVITLLEKTAITKETLEKTRIGKYINELRKRTNNEQLARRAKELVRSWRQLLPADPGQSFNGKRVTGPTGPGPGSYPYPGNKVHKSTIPGSPRYKTGSPSILYERSASPFCSSASSSPQSVVKLQGSNRPPTPPKLNQIVLHDDKIGNQNKALLSSAYGKNNSLSSQVFKPVSPAMQTTANSNSGSISYTNVLPQPKPQSPYASPAHVNNTGSFCLTNTSINDPAGYVNEQQKYECMFLNSPTIASGSVHSSLEIAKTNVANKRLRKSSEGGSSAKKVKCSLNDLSNECHLQNGADSSFESSSAFEHSPTSSFKCLKPECESEKKVSESNACSDALKERLSSVSLGTKLQKVKTTQQLIKELQAKKDSLNLSYLKIRDHPEIEPDLFIWKKSPNQATPSSELSRSKSELMKKFLSSSPESPSATSDHGSSVTDRASSPCSDIVPSKSSVITSEKDSTIPYVDPIEKEIEEILSQLPPINPEVLNYHEDPVSEQSVPVSYADANRYLTEHVEGVNGNYDMHDIWRSWQECVETEILPGEKMTILPYVNNDW